MVDICTRFCLLRPLKDKRAATVVFELVKVFSDFGYPTKLGMDNGSEMKNMIMKLLCESMHIDQRLITPYKASSNGTSERWVQSAKLAIAKSVEGAGHQWDLFTPGKNVMSYEQLIERIDVMSDVVFPAIMDKTNAYVDNMKDKFDKYKNIVKDFEKGAPVMVRFPTLKGSLTPSYMGPYTIVRKTKGGSYVLSDETGLLMDRDYTPSELKAISQDNILNEDDGNHIYEIEGILDHRGTGSNIEYKIRWKGYSQEEDSWLRPEMITHEHIIQQYWRRKLGKDYKP
ncbi:hypothetical protein [Parasitella parasitica]|uniref:Integrase catalytic domain-containing protein n=1 Tax=Parasitella parasitica TaxID=35722 RepID=A0A0B7NAB8_9FUNG|nr:hypothetical protein [Parasitella parasitica]